jgi:hypothetical protein
MIAEWDVERQRFGDSGQAGCSPDCLLWPGLAHLEPQEGLHDYLAPTTISARARLCGERREA